MTLAEAAKIMSVSRPTLTRIYGTARKKVSMAMVEGRYLLIRESRVDFNGNWYRCFECQSIFNDISKGINRKCPRCASVKVTEVSSGENVESAFKPIEKQGFSGFCYCKSCHTLISHKIGKSCSAMLCPNCNEKIVRETLADVIVPKILWAIPVFGVDKNASYNTRFTRSPFFALYSKNQKIEFFENPF